MSDSDREKDKWETIEGLGEEGGKRKFIGVFEKKLASFRRLIEQGDRLRIKHVIREMKEAADQIRARKPEIAKLLDEARQKVEDLFKNS